MTAFSQSDYLSIFTHAPAEAVKALAEAILPDLGAIQVLKNRTGLVMLPYSDSAGGVTFHLGEILVSEAHIQLENGTEGYALVTGRDLVLAVGIAVLDAAMQTGIHTETITAFLVQAHADQAAADDHLLKQVEATRIEMETF
ncbi:MAG: phosphonate C-P lyase system protein PhnG [Anaerolineae bacterium]